MTLTGLPSEKRLERRLPLVSLLLVFTFLSHSIAMATDGHRSDAAPSEQYLTSHSELVDHTITSDASERPCDVGRNVSLAPGQNRPEHLMTPDATGWCPGSLTTTEPSGFSSAPPISAKLLRALLQVFLN